METFSKKLPGTCLLLGSMMAVLTMVLHPVGGDLQHIIKIRKVLFFSHALAISCVPLIAFGLWGLCKSLTTANRLAVLGFLVAMLGLSAAVLAATLNGLVLPRFASHFDGRKLDAANLEVVLAYSSFFNRALAQIFMVSIAVAILVWSLVMIRGVGFTKGLGFYGLLVFVFAVIALLSGLNMTSVSLFGTFIFGLASWLFLTGALLVRTADHEKLQ